MVVVERSTCTIRKHNQLQVLSSRFKSIDEQRFLNSCLDKNWQRELIKEEAYLPVDISNYASKQNISLGQAYSELRAIADRFTEEMRVVLDTGETWVTRVIYDYKFQDEGYTLSVQFNKNLIPYISGYMEEGTFMTYDNRMDKVSSNRRYLMAELIQKHLYKLKKEGRFILSLREIRFGLNLKDTEYKVYSQLNAFVIKPTLQDIATILGEHIVAKKTSIGVIFSRKELAT